MKRIKAFILGVVEFRSSFTTHLRNYDLLIAYDRGRDLMHALTLRRFED